MSGGCLQRWTRSSPSQLKRGKGDSAIIASAKKQLEAGHNSQPEGMACRAVASKHNIIDAIRSLAMLKV